MHMHTYTHEILQGIYVYVCAYAYVYIQIHVCVCIHIIYILVYIQSLCEEKLYLIFHVLKLSFEAFFSTHSSLVLQTVLDNCLVYVPLNFLVGCALALFSNGASFLEY